MKFMKHILHEEKAELSTGTTIRLLRSREESRSKEFPDEDDPRHWKVGATHNELTASFWDSKKTKWRDFIHMSVASCELESSMKVFLNMAKAEIERLLPRFAKVDKIARKDCQIVQSFTEFAEALQRR